MTTPDLNLAANMFGPLDGEIRARLMAAISNPCEHTWDDAKSIMLDRGKHGIGTTLWQAVITVDPDFASVKGPVTRETETGRAERVSGWSRTPSAETIVQAINYATH